MAAAGDSSDGSRTAEAVVRRRRTGAAPAEEAESPPAQERPHLPLRPGTFWLTRVVLLRAIAFIYFVAFLVAYHQNKQLIGDQGLLPCRLYLKNVQNYFGGKLSLTTFSYAPTVIWFMDWSSMDTNLDCLSLLGLALSAFVLMTGSANVIMMTLLWILYHSIISVGQIWYSFGWESQLLETGFLGIFLCPVWTISKFPEHTPPPKIVIWAFRWLIFRIMLGAGLIKIRGDRCWRELTCMNHHYETQPVPNYIAYYMHQSPSWFHQMEILVNHFVELIVPFFIFLGRRLCTIHGIVQILFQVLLIISGNLSFLNWLTIVPSIACFDDVSLGFLFDSKEDSIKSQVCKMQAKEVAGEKPPPRWEPEAKVPVRSNPEMRTERETDSDQGMLKMAEKGSVCRIAGEVKCQRRPPPSRSSDKGRSRCQGCCLFRTVKQSKGPPSKIRSRSPVRQKAGVRNCQARSLSRVRRQSKGQAAKQCAKQVCRRERPALKEPSSGVESRAQHSEIILSKHDLAAEVIQHSHSPEREKDRGPTEQKAPSSIPEQLLHKAKLLENMVGTAPTINLQPLHLMCANFFGCSVRQVMNISLGVLIAYLSIPVVQNLLNPKQVMNTSFNPLKIVNTYGAFGSITKERTEVILQGTYSENPNDPTAIWQEYEFNCKPGEMRWRPCLITPYHYRLDWLMWFAAFQTYEQNEWIIHLAGKLLDNESGALSLLQHNPFEGRKPPRWIRGEHYRYKFSQLGGRHAAEGKWWIRRRIGPYFPPVNLEGLKKYFESRNWPHPHGS